jgi:Na+-translocating ferredoxin:NAD+ oxidoreductase RNF subunit RnfB
MTTTLFYTVISLSLLGAVAAVVLYFVAQRFKVYEDPRIDLVEAELPAANCGGCGFAGCRNFAETLVKAPSLEGFFCPVGGNDVMSKVASILGKEALTQLARVAVLRCNGSCDVRPVTSRYDGTSSCAVVSALYGGETGCAYGCVGLGDCVAACSFDAMYMDEKTGLPVIVDEKCTACGACVKACPKILIELRKKWKGDKKIYVSCMNEDRGPVARKNCAVACIGCGKCVKVCPHDAIVMNNYLAFIDSDKCKLCRKCVPECPTSAIIEIGFPPRKATEPVTGTTAEGSDTIIRDQSGSSQTSAQSSINKE